MIRFDDQERMCQVVDCHAHMGYFGAFHIHEPHQLSIMKRMDFLGIDLMCFSHHLGIGADFTAGNLLSEQTCMNHPNRFRYYLAINPGYRALVETQIEQYRQSPGAIGFKIHPPFFESAMDHPNLIPVYEQANHDQSIILIHVWGIESVLVLAKLAERYPFAQFIAGHGGGDFRGMEACAKLIRNCRNVYADTAISRPFQGNVEWMVEHAGSNRILFASDMPFYDPSHTLGRILMSDLDLESKTAILGQNMLQLIEMRQRG